MDLSNNLLEELPNEISQMKELQRLNLSNNKFRTIPKVIMSIPSLIEVDLQGNPFINIIEVQLQSISDGRTIQAYLRDVSESIREWTECKVLILGDQVCISSHLFA